MSRVLKKKVVKLTIRNRKYKYTEILEELINSEPVETIDLTNSPSTSPNPSRATTPAYIRYTSQATTPSPQASPEYSLRSP